MSDMIQKPEKEIPKKLDELTRVVDEVAGVVEQLLTGITPMLSVPAETAGSEAPRQEPSCGMAKDLDHSVARLQSIREQLRDARRRLEV